MTKRKKLKNMCTIIYNHRGQLGYLERRPMKLTQYRWEVFVNQLRRGDQFVSDCSETLTALFKWAGFKDPNGLGYNNEGNSETMLAHLRHFVRGRFANIGTIVHFENPDHVAVVIRASRLKGNPTIWGHGRPGIAINTVSEEARLHKGSVTYLGILNL